MTDIETPRLILRLVPLAGLAATAARDADACARLIAPDLPPEWFDDAPIFDMRFRQWKDDPAYAPWSIRAIVLKATRQVVGYINCHDRPVDFIHGGRSGTMIELGYDVFAAYRRRGIATEAIGGVTGLARRHGVSFLRLSIAPGNAPSRALAERLGAEKIGTQIDEIDGPEDVYLVRL